MHCIIIGDSIAVRVHQAAPECQVAAMGGINSADYAAKYTQQISADITVISLTANDHANTDLDTLRLIRSRVTTGRVVWLLPNISRRIQLEAVAEMVCEFGDRLINTGLYIHNKRLHPNEDESRAIAKAALMPLDGRPTCNN